MTVTSVHELLRPDGTLSIIDVGPLDTEAGERIESVSLAVQRWGEISPTRDNVVLVEHALTGDSHVIGAADDTHPSPGWWEGMIGPGAPVDTNEWCVIAANVLGGCHGSTGPSSLAPDGKPYGSRFPYTSIRDQVAAERLLMDRLGIERLGAVVGGSMGGMRALEWVASYPDQVGAALIVAVGARATADQIGTQTTQIAAITSDPNWQGGDYYGTGHAPNTGLGLARRFAHLTYRTEHELDSRFSNAPQTGEDPWDGGRYAVQSYLEHQADKLVNRFDPGTYVLLTEAMNRHDVGRGRGGVAAALSAVTAPVIVAGVDSDRLYPLRLQEELAELIPTSSELRVVESRDGHDGFLTEATAMAQLLSETMELARTAR
ncbi:MAG: homoserine O-acetyltransferase [Rhodococcus sp.]|nr:homoserine O-acetyltransferase [Rhodococcus sp. (in: high G+C Gram-positive bacteria)]